MASKFVPRMGVVWSVRKLARLGLGPATSGNTSVRGQGGFFIKESGISPDWMRSTNVAFVQWGKGPDPVGPTPSSEWRFHEAIYEARPDVEAIAHCHSNFATLLACAGIHIRPDTHYHSGFFGGEIRCTERFELPGSEELAASIVAALEGRNGCLIANHGQVTVGETIEQAVERAEMLEQLAFFEYATSNGKVGHRSIPEDALRVLEGALARYGRK